MQDFYNLKRENNPHREDACTLSCLGKLHPASSSDFTRYGSWLSELLDDLDLENPSKHEILIAGLTESGIIPAFLMYLESSKREMNTHLVYSTRRPISGIAFNERHSHGPDHVLPLAARRFKELWIVEDEITSGNTVLNLIFQLHNHMKIERVRIFAFADFRNNEQKTMLISRTAKNNICCTVHIPAIFQKENNKVNSGNPLVLNDIMNKGAMPGNRGGSMDELIYNKLHLQTKRPALGVKSGNFFDSAFWKIPFEFSGGTLLTVGESVDIAACLVWANDSLSFQQISLSPWKVDNQSIFSKMTFADKYYLYNYENLKEPVFILCDPIDKEIEIEVIEKLQAHGICVKPFLPITEKNSVSTPKSATLQEKGLSFKNPSYIKKDSQPQPKGLETNTCFRAFNGLSWNQFFYLNLGEEVHPFRDMSIFRPLNKAYTGNNTFWSTPSPEPDLNDQFWQDVETSFKSNNTIQKAAQHLAASILQQYPDPDKILFVSILRAGVPITDWLCQLLPGSVGAALSLFVGLGMDTVALNQLRNDFPDRSIVFVDGWTGRGGVAKAISSLEAGPLAVLIDPWGWAEFSGIQEDVFCPSACFTGLATLGFSRTFFVDENKLFSAYKFADKFSQTELVKNWQSLCPKGILTPRKKDINKFFTETPLRIHSNEVCRALINAAPKTLFFADDKSFAEQNFSLLIKLAEKRSVPLEFNAKHLKEMKTKVACSFETV